MPTPIRSSKDKFSHRQRRDFLRNRSPKVALHKNVNAMSRVSPCSLDDMDEDETRILKLREEQRLIQRNICTREHVPSHASFAVGQLNSLLNYIAPGSIVAFDIDDTLVKKHHYGSTLVTSQGTGVFFKYVSTNLKHLSFSEKQGLVNKLHTEAKKFDLAELDTATVVKTLQSRGCYVFGLTARSPNMATATNMSLSGLNINLALTPPPTLPTKAVEPTTGATVIDGIIYCGEVDKGIVFQKFLNIKWISWPNKHNCQVELCNTSCKKNNQISSNSIDIPFHGHTDDGKGCPDRTIWFIDDCLPMIQGMVQQWGVMAHGVTQMQAQMKQMGEKMHCNGKLALVCCHYQHPSSSSTPNVPEGTLTQVIEVEIAEFIKSGRILTDLQAYNLLINNEKKDNHVEINVGNETLCQ